MIHKTDTPNPNINVKNYNRKTKTPYNQLLHLNKHSNQSNNKQP